VSSARLALSRLSGRWAYKRSNFFSIASPKGSSPLAAPSEEDLSCFDASSIGGPERDFDENGGSGPERGDGGRNFGTFVVVSTFVSSSLSSKAKAYIWSSMNKRQPFPAEAN